jgi:hypothetical protein
MAENNDIARSAPVGELISNNLIIPVYQRPYSWGKKQVYQLLDDLKEAKDHNESSYLVGTIIIFENTGKKHEIVDGQQRLTTLTLILKLLGHDALGLLNHEYSHSESVNNLVQNYRAIKNWLERKELLGDKAFREFILTNVCFVRIQAPSQDEAFVFFDSQNSRGKSLEKYDLLKAHHLRYISDANERVAEECTIFWEKIDKSGGLGYLIDTLLGRTRVWSRKEYVDVDVLEEFKSQRVTNNSDGFYQLNHYQQPPIFEKWRYIDREVHDDNDGLELVYRDIDAWHGTKRLKFVSESKRFLPFQLLQPLEGGEQFFWFIEKYEQLRNELFSDEKEKSLPVLFLELYNVYLRLDYNLGMNYIRQVFEACCLFYYDKFGTENILEFALCVEHQLSILRFNKASVQRASIDKFIREGDNIFSIIHEAAFPEHIIRKMMQKTEGRYKSIDKSFIESGFRKNYFEVLYGSDGFYTKYRSEIERYPVLKIKDKFKNQLQ